MLRAVFASVCLALGLALVAGCGNQSSSSGPHLANPNDPKVKDIKPRPPVGGPIDKGNKGGFTPQ